MKVTIDRRDGGHMELDEVATVEIGDWEEDPSLRVPQPGGGWVRSDEPPALCAKLRFKRHRDDFTFTERTTVVVNIIRIEVKP